MTESCSMSSKIWTGSKVKISDDLCDHIPLLYLTIFRLGRTDIKFLQKNSIIIIMLQFLVKLNTN